MISNALESRVQDLHNALYKTNNRCLGGLEIWFEVWGSDESLRRSPAGSEHFVFGNCDLQKPTPNPTKNTVSHSRPDLCCWLQTGSGKTLAFGLPILEGLLRERESAAGELAQLTMANRVAVKTDISCRAPVPH